MGLGPGGAGSSGGQKGDGRAGEGPGGGGMGTGQGGGGRASGKVGPEGSVDDTRGHPDNPDAERERDEIAAERQTTTASIMQNLANVVTSYAGVTMSPSLNLNVGQPKAPEVGTRATWGPGTMAGAWTGIPGAALAGGWLDRKAGTQVALNAGTPAAPGTAATDTPRPGLLTAGANPAQFGVSQLAPAPAPRASVAQPGNYAVTRGLLKA